MPSSAGLVVILVVAATMILFSEKELSSRWGVSFLGEDGTAGDRAIVKKQELANRCQELARSYGLSPREEEVLLLLAQRKTVGSIERELFIANGTAKTHIRHIYRKLDIHSRDELSDLLDYSNNLTNKCSYHMLYCSRTKEPVQALNPTPPEGRAAHR